MEMSEHDRRMATERCKEFIKDREELLKVLVKEIDGIVPIVSLPPPQKQQVPWYMNEMGDYFSDPAMALHEKICTKWDIQDLCLCNEEGSLGLIIHEREAVKEVSDVEWARLLTTNPQESIATPFSRVKGDCLYIKLRIDLRRSEEELRDAFSRKIMDWKIARTVGKERPDDYYTAFWKRFAALRLKYPDDDMFKITRKAIKVERKVRATIYDPWEIYNKHQAGKSLLEIARELHGKNYPPGKRSPAYNEKLWAPYKDVRRAYNQAQKMIKAVEEGAHRRMKSLEEELRDLRQAIDQKSKEPRAKWRKTGTKEEQS